MSPGSSRPSLLFAATLLLGCESERGSGTVSIALSEDACARYCLSALRATLYPEGDALLPLGPALQIGCGEALSFAALPAGERVVVRLSAFDVTGEVQLAGESTPVTIAADGVTEVHVPLVALAAPEIATVSPEPIVVAEGPAAISLVGTFGEPLGDAGVELGTRSFGPTEASWSPEGDRITLDVPAGTGGDSLVVRRCGIASEPYPLRLIAATAGEAAVVGGPACAGAAARAATPYEGDALVAWGCDDGAQGTLMRMSADDALCPLDPGASWSLGREPLALAAMGGSAWVGTAAGLLHIDLDAAGSVATPIALGAETAVALAATSRNVYAILDADDGGRVAAIDGSGARAVPGVDAALSPVALAATAERAFVVAHAGSGEGRLVAIPDSGVVTTWSLAAASRSCDRPSAIACSPDGARVVVACADGGLAAWETAAQRLSFIDLGGAAEALALDDLGDVAFAGLGTSLMVIDLEAGALLHAFARPSAPAGRPPLLVALGSHRLLASAAVTPLAVITPFDGAGPCGGGP